MQLSRDGGATWSVVLLPQQAVGGSPDVLIDPDGAIRLAIPTATGATVLTRAAGATGWTSYRLRADWVDGTTLAGGGTAAFVDSAPGLVGVVLTAGRRNGDGASELYVSSDEGRTFTGRWVHADYAEAAPHAPVIVLDARTAIAAVSALTPRFAVTHDGGATWTPVPAVPPAGLAPTAFTTNDPGQEQALYGVAEVRADGARLPVSLVDPDGSQTFQMYDVRVSGLRPVGPRLTSGARPGPDWASVSDHGTWWVAPSTGGTIHRSTDDGETWTTIYVPSLPVVGGLVVTGPSALSAASYVSACSATLWDTCWIRSRFYVTADGDTTWRRITPHLPSS